MSASSSAGAQPHVELIDITKRYDGVKALDGVSLTVERGQIHALVGENGAGKSTLGKILAGVTRRDGGVLRIDGGAVHYGTPHDALGHGIALVHQEISLVPTMSVLENVFLGAESTGGLVRRGAMLQRFRELDGRTGFGLDPDALVADLPLAGQQKVEITRALARDAELIVFDEPTAPLDQEEANRLYEILNRLRDGGTTIVYVSHFLAEVLQLADTVSVLKDGRLVRTAPAADETVDSLIFAMLGRSLESTFPPKQAVPSEAPAVLRVENLTRTGIIEDVSFELRAGEIVGLAGLVGSGRSELARMIFGRDRVDRGTVELNGERLPPRGPRGAIAKGIAYLPESRKDQGMIAMRSVRENLTLPTLDRFARGTVIRVGAERVMARQYAERIGLQPPDPERIISTLSGGNQQKVMLGRWLMAGPDVLIADEPTRGVDVGAKRAIYDMVVEMAEQRLAVLLISSDLEEVMGLSHRILVLCRGKLVGEFPGDASEDEILTAAFGEHGRDRVA